MKEQSNKLKPCPFCGAEAQVQKPETWFWFIECGHLCGAMTRVYETYDEAAKAWNSKTMFKYRSERNGIATDVTFYRDGRLFSYPKIQQAMEHMRAIYEHNQR